ncbi:juvenile hormone epoxide hydrolase 1 [Daphnia magna]|uniref:Epoxide hydrolase n=3 Tax=Daphnia magna TaxID=35525 RepID=A0A0P5ZLI5_9CRUS|nr:juvenile hormone epoxide hydrolase 1 [Daphnia magna]
MGFLRKLLLIKSAITVVFIARYLLKNPVIPQLKDQWWADGSPKVQDEKITPFKIKVSDEVLIDLNERLFKSTRMVPALEGIGFQYGFNAEFLKTVQQYWMNKYNWKEQEAFLNTFAHFKTNIGGLGIHFIHAKPSKELMKNKKVLPLLLLHGWPGSFIEFTKIIPLLTRETEGYDFVFELVVPSLPGYGFSDPARKPGLGPAEMGLIFDRLMKRLGYDKYYVQGGDWGSLIGSNMATLFPDRVKGLHLNMVAVSTIGSNVGLMLGSLWPSLLMPADKVHLTYPLSSRFLHIIQETGYFHIQATKPDTVGMALSDSPIGLAAYILEKFSTWTKASSTKLQDGGLLQKFTMDELLNNVMIYWTTNSITTSMRLYSEAMSAKTFGYDLDNIACVVPTGAAVFPEELFVQPAPLVKFKFTNLITYNIMDRGGHFAAYEEPQLLADEVLQFVQQVEKL